MAIFELKSRAFNNGENIPSKYTCDGENISPPLQWENYPGETKSFALIAEDPDAPGGIFIHWVIFNIPPDIKSLAEEVTTTKNIPINAVQGTNHYGDTGYGGPCPPKGVHRYYFKLYALDSILHLDERAGKRDVMKAMQEHILAEAELMGKYERE